MIARISILSAIVLTACGADAKGTRDTQADTAAPDTTPADTAIADTADTTDTTIADTADTADTIAADTADSTIADTTPPDTTADTEVTVVEVEVEVAQPASCIDEGHAVGERYPLGDDCNFCDCLADGSAACSAHTCKSDVGGCTYGRDFPYAARFKANDGCNDCVCAASGLACTHRCSDLPQEGAILLDSLDAPCGDNPAFTGAAVLAGMPYTSFEAPFTYVTDGPLYPETLPPTTIRVQVAYEPGGFIACRIPSPDQPALDIEATVEWRTADGELDEGFHTYLRRNDFGFLDAWMFAMGAGPHDLDGSFDPACFDANGFSFGMLVYSDGHTDGDFGKACETDILLPVGGFSYTPR